MRRTRTGRLSCRGPRTRRTRLGARHAAMAERDAAIEERPAENRLSTTGMSRQALSRCLAPRRGPSRRGLLGASGRDADELDRLGPPLVGAPDEGALQPHVAFGRLEPDG